MALARRYAEIACLMAAGFLMACGIWWYEMSLHVKPEEQDDDFQ